MKSQKGAEHACKIHASKTVNMWGRSSRVGAAMQSSQPAAHQKLYRPILGNFVQVTLCSQGRQLRFPLTYIYSLTNTHKRQVNAFRDLKSIYPSKMGIPLCSTTHTVQSLSLFTFKKDHFQAVLPSCLI